MSARSLFKAGQYVGLRWMAARLRSATAFAASLVLAVAPLAAAEKVELPPTAIAQIQALIAEKEARTPAQKRIDSQLLYAARKASARPIANGVATLETDVRVDPNGMVEVEIRAKADRGVEALVRKVGGKVTRSFDFADAIEALVPIARLEEIAADNEVRFIRPKAQATTQREGKEDARKRPQRQSKLEWLKQALSKRVAKVAEQDQSESAASEDVLPGEAIPAIGSRSSQGDVTHRANTVRSQLGVNGGGVCVGVISDSFNSLGAAVVDVVNGDLPGPDNPNGYLTPVGLAGSGDFFGGSDEGRAMLQIVHDLAPGARLYFATAFNSITDFANNIRALRGIAANPGTFGNVSPKCDILVDDVYYFVETGLHDGQSAPSDANMAIVNQAVNDVVADGALYFSSIGNSGSVAQGTAAAWEGDFVGTGGVPLPGLGTGDALRWNGADVGNTLTAVNGPVTMQWSDPIGASTNDYDLFLLDNALANVVATSTNVQNGTQDPYEELSTSNAGAGSRLVVVRRAGAAARFISLTANRGRLQYATAGQARGHAAVPAAFGVAATPATTSFGPPTPNGPYPNPFVASNQVERFSSDGPRRSFFNANGTAITPGNFLAGSGGGALRQKPDFTAADGVDTTLPSSSGLNPFYGTSASAPHAAAIAALIRQMRPAAAQGQIAAYLTSTALDIMGAGIDVTSGAGIVQALPAALAAAPAEAFVVPTTVAVTPTGGNALIEPNECNQLTLGLANAGNVAATVVSNTLATSTPGVAIAVPTSAYPNLPALGGAGNNFTPFQVSTSRSLACATVANFSQTITYAGGASPRVYNFTLPIGKPNNYQFSAGTGASFAGGATGPIAISPNNDDGLGSIVVPAGFNFKVYDTTVAGGSTLRASTNGNLQIIASGGDNAFFNTALPASGFGSNVPVLMPFWDDLVLDTSGGGIYTNLVGTAPHRQFIVEWRGRRFGTGTTPINFGIVFNEGSNGIEYRYPLIDSSVSATVGIQASNAGLQFTQYAFEESTVTSGTVLTGTLAPGCTIGPAQCSAPLFADVPAGSWAALSINSIYNNIPRITNGCAVAPLRYCPLDPVTREQMAAFIIRAIEGEPAANLCGSGSPFADVPTTSLFCGYIKRLAARGITTGCGSGNFCPKQAVNRNQIAVLLIRSLEGEPAGDLCDSGSPFTDVPPTSGYCRYIKRLAELGITKGCGPGLYCPTAIVARDAMAVFLGRAFLGL